MKHPSQNPGLILTGEDANEASESETGLFSDRGERKQSDRVIDKPSARKPIVVSH